MAERLPADIHFGRLGFDGRGIVVERDRGCARVLADSQALGGQVAARARESDPIIVTLHAFDFNQLMWAHGAEKVIPDGAGKLELGGGFRVGGGAFALQAPDSTTHNDTPTHSIPSHL